jgi:hypothetical protein
MKTQNKHRFLSMGVLMAVLVSAFMYSCKDDDPTLSELRADKLAYLADSLRISDSLKRINAAGVVNYSVTVVDGATSSIFAQGRTQTALDGAIVTISQFGKELSDTTDATGIAVFNGFFKSAVNVTIRKEGFTSVSYIAQTNLQQGDSTGRGTISFVGNLIPIFATTGATTATISGVAKIQSDLTNATRENVPDGTTVLVGIDASAGSDFADKFLTSDLEWSATASCGCNFAVVGRILQASYQTGIVGSVTAGAYTATVPAAIDGLPLVISYSDIALDQSLFENVLATGQRTIVNRTFFNTETDPGNVAAIPASSTVTVAFETFTTEATATAEISSGNGSLDRITVTDGGIGYTTAPVIVISTPVSGGTAATATATVAGGRITGITLTNAGSGYTAAPTITIRAGAGATASSALAQDGVVVGVVISNSGSGYVAPPTVTFSAPGGTGVTATGTANIDAAGRVTSVNINNAGSGYTGNPTVGFSPAPPGGTTATSSGGIYSGNSISSVSVTAPGSFYLSATPPTVSFGPPQRANGVRATGTATVDPATGFVTGILVTSPGSGYTSAPTVVISQATGASAAAVLTAGTVTAIQVGNPGAGYTGVPVVTLSGDGTGAAATATVVDGRVTAINVTNAGSGYTSAPTVALSAGDGAHATALVTNGAISSFLITDGGRNFTGNPRVVITSANGSGGTATATAAGGQITGIAVGTGGAGYLASNVPAAGEAFLSSYGINSDNMSEISTRPGLKYVNDIYYGTGVTRNPN